MLFSAFFAFSAVFSGTYGIALALMADQTGRANRMEQALPSSVARFQPSGVETPARNEAHSSGVSWAAVVAGAPLPAARSPALAARRPPLRPSSAPPSPA